MELSMDWKTVVDEAPVAIVIIDSRGQVVYVNKVLLERSGLSFEEATKHPEKFFPPEDFEKLSQYVLETFLKRRKNPDPAITIRGLSATEGEVWLEARARYAEIEGEPYCLLAYTDVNQRVRLQKQVESLNEYLKFLNSMLRHDILNIFTRMQAYCELLEEEFKPEYLEKIKESIESGVRLIHKIRELESSTTEDKKSYRLSEVIKEVSKGFDVKVNLKGDAVITANDGIYSVFENLIGNAVKHGGATEVSVEVWDEGDHCEVIFRDNGRGIPEEIREKVFEKGFTTGRGSGLGLYIVKKLIESYGGDIELLEGKAAAFVIRLPKSQPSGLDSSEKPSR